MIATMGNFTKVVKKGFSSAMEEKKRLKDESAANKISTKLQVLVDQFRDLKDQNDSLKDIKRRLDVISQSIKNFKEDVDVLMIQLQELEPDRSDQVQTPESFRARRNNLENLEKEIGDLNNELGRFYDEEQKLTKEYELKQQVFKESYRKLEANLRKPANKELIIERLNKFSRTTRSLSKNKSLEKDVAPNFATKVKYIRDNADSLLSEKDDRVRLLEEDDVIEVTIKLDREYYVVAIDFSDNEVSDAIRIARIDEEDGKVAVLLGNGPDFMSIDWSNLDLEKVNQSSSEDEPDWDNVEKYGEQLIIQLYCQLEKFPKVTPDQYRINNELNILEGIAKGKEFVPNYELNLGGI